MLRKSPLHALRPPQSAPLMFRPVLQPKRSPPLPAQTSSGQKLAVSSLFDPSGRERAYEASFGQVDGRQSVNWRRNSGCFVSFCLKNKRKCFLVCNLWPILPKQCESVIKSWISFKIFFCWNRCLGWQRDSWSHNRDPIKSFGSYSRQWTNAEWITNYEPSRQI